MILRTRRRAVVESGMEFSAESVILPLFIIYTRFTDSQPTSVIRVHPRLFHLFLTRGKPPRLLDWPIRRTVTSFCGSS